MNEIKKFESEELSIIKVNNLKALKDAGETLQKLAKDNAFIDPTAKTINEAEKRRKSLKIGRTTVNRYETEIKSSLSKAGKCIKGIAEELRAIVEPSELKQAEANTKYFDLEAWEKAKIINTKEAYSAYIDDWLIHVHDAQCKYEQIEEKEVEAKEIYEGWIKHVNQTIILAKTIEELNIIEKALDNEDVEKFFDPVASFDKREDFYNVIDLKKTDIEKAEKERKEREAKEAKEKEESEKRAKEIDKRNEKLRIDAVKLADEVQKKEAEDKIKREKEAAKIKAERQKENVENAEIVLDSVDISIDNIDTLEKANLYVGKLENTISKDFGTKDNHIRTLYTNVKTRLESRRNDIVSGIQKTKAEEAKIENEKKLEADKRQKEIDAKVKAERDKESEAERIKNATYAKQKNDALLQIKGELSDEFKNIVAEHKALIEKYNLKQDIINYISELL